MCGVSAIISTSTRPPYPLRRSIERMTRAQTHRGPDHSGIWLNEGVALGHNRLRVLDLSERADQPFTRSAPGSPVLIFNGEIYNHRELRLELERAGVELTTHGDTEVLFEALARWGEGALERIHGMFAFVFLWPDRHEIVAARDRMGIKPLHWCRSDHGVLLASEVSGLLASGWVEPTLDPEAVYQVARFNHLLARRTAVQGVEAVAPGELLRIDTGTGRVSPRTYWTLRFQSGRRGRPYAQRRAALDTAFRSAVESHLVADLPVAGYLSGGIDSTGLAHEVSRNHRGRFRTYSLLFPDQPYDEGPTIDRVLRALEVENRQVALEKVSLGEYVAYIERAGMPQLWTTDLALERLAAGVARAGHRVVLSGEGPDELFAGYDAFRWMRLRGALEKLRLLPLLERMPPRLKLSKSLSWFQLDLAMVRYYASAHRRAKRRGMEQRYGFHPENVATWDLLVEEMRPAFRADFAARFEGYRRTEEEVLAGLFGPETRNYSHLQKNLLFELRVRLPNWVLLMADRMSAAHGLELRVPYLDDRFVEEALALPDRDRLLGMNEKHILKSIHRDRVPTFVRRRHKQPLYTPITEWIGDFFTDPDFESFWSRDLFEEVGLFDFETAQQVARTVAKGEYDHLMHRLTNEWMFLLMLSTHITQRRMRAIVTDARAS